MKTGEQNRNNKRTEIKRFHWFIERIQTHLAFGWLSERSDGKTLCPTNFLVIALTSHCNTIGQSNNAFSILGFFFEERQKSNWLDWHKNNFAPASRFLYISLPSLHDYDVKMPVFSFCGGREGKTTTFLFFS